MSIKIDKGGTIKSATQEQKEKVIAKIANARVIARITKTHGRIGQIST